MKPRVQVFLDALSHVVGQVQSKQLLMQHCHSTQQTGRLQLLGMLLGVSEWTQSFHARLTFPSSCVEEVAAELENAVEVSVVSPLLRLQDVILCYGRPIRPLYFHRVVSSIYLLYFFFLA